MTFIALHGFLGSPADWTPWIGPDFIPWSVGGADSLQSWAQAFNHQIRANTQPPRILLGYSMGGRLALHALIQAPHLFAGGVLISTHTGLASAQEREKRLAHDQLWAERFLKDPWDKLMHDWENQPIFQNANHRFSRPESERELLAKQLQNFSLGQQTDLTNLLPNLPLLWMAGERDLSYSHLAHEVCRKHASSTLKLLPQAGHRAPWEAPKQFADSIRDIKLDWIRVSRG